MTDCDIVSDVKSEVEKDAANVDVDGLDSVMEEVGVFGGVSESDGVL